jgi:hypothetical protein
MPHLHQLTTGELSTTITACKWLSGQTPVAQLLDPVACAKVSTLLADCTAEWEDRKRAEQDSRRQAVAAHTDPMAHYTA